MKRLVYLILPTLLTACGGGSGDPTPTQENPPTIPSALIDLKAVAAAMQMMRATLMTTVGATAYSQGTNTSGLDRACSLGGDASLSSLDSDGKITLSACVTREAPGVTYNGRFDGPGNFSGADFINGAGTFLGITESISVTGSGKVFADYSPSSTQLGTNFTSYTIQFGSGAKYVVGSGNGRGTLTIVGADSSYAGSFVGSFTYKDRSHTLVSDAPLNWEPGVGVTAGMLRISSQDPVSGGRNYNVTFGAGGRFTMQGLSGAQSGSFDWSAPEFQAALKAVLQP